jgi:predicted DNA-binding helix-hairpin-helix protein
MEQLIRTVQNLRSRGFNGYVHRRLKSTPNFTPAGQSTRLIIGASPESGDDMLHRAQSLYRSQALERVYCSGCIPGNAADPRLPELPEPPMAREYRLCPADRLMRLYGYSLEEVIRPEQPYLDLKTDPKLEFALRPTAIWSTGSPEMRRDIRKMAAAICPRRLTPPGNEIIVLDGVSRVGRVREGVHPNKLGSETFRDRTGMV